MDKPSTSRKRAHSKTDSTDIYKCYCNNYFQPPIYLCEQGHSLCEICKEKYTNCPRCYSTILNRRNHTLEVITEQASHQCKYMKDGCEFKGKLNKKHPHEEQCDYRPITCPVCNNEIPRKWFLVHVKENHSANQLRNYEPFSHDITNTVLKVIFLEHRVFVIKLLKIMDQILQIDTNEYPNSSSHNRLDDKLFYVNIIDQDDEGKKVTTSTSLIKNKLSFHKDQLAAFIKDDNMLSLSLGFGEDHRKNRK